MKRICLALCIVFSIVFLGCKNKSKPIVNLNPIIIWTESPDFASCVELFNATHENEKAIVIYKESVSKALHSVSNEQVPDIVIGSWLKNSQTRKYFSQLDFLFQEQQIFRSSFYSKILDYGMLNDKQYLIPVSFNLPAIIFNKKNESYVESTHLLNVAQIKQFAGNFNKKNKSDVYTAIGYAPSWDPEFLYELAKLNGAQFREKGVSFTWNPQAIENIITSTKEWTIARNGSTSIEQNFQFKYLFMPKYRQVSTDHCLFAYETSNNFFPLIDSQNSSLSFRWLEKDSHICIEDDIVTMGLYKHSKNKNFAYKFIVWFNNEETQKALIERKHKMNLDIISFGIAGGFSAIKAVNEKYYPLYYRQVLGNMPSENYFELPKILPYRWPNLKKNVILPFLQESCNTDEKKECKTIEQRIQDWKKTYF